MGYSAGEAAKATGVSVPTITRAIKSGRISANRRDGGGYDIDPAELHRVFPAVASNSNATPSMSGYETPIDTGALQVEIRMLRERMEEKEAEARAAISDRESTISDLRRRLDSEADERRRLTALLTHQAEMPTPAPQEPPTARPRRWWPFGAGNRDDRPTGGN